MDIRMPGMDGLAATEAICGGLKLADTRILILTTFETEQYVARALRARASGFLGQTATTDQLLEAIRTVAVGESPLSPRATRLPATSLASTPKHPEPGRACRPDGARARGDGSGRPRHKQ